MKSKENVISFLYDSHPRLEETLLKTGCREVPRFCIAIIHAPFVYLFIFHMAQLSCPCLQRQAHKIKKLSITMFAYTNWNIWASSTNANANPRVKIWSCLFVTSLFFVLFFYDDKVMKWQMLLELAQLLLLNAAELLELIKSQLAS